MQGDSLLLTINPDYELLPDDSDTLFDTISVTAGDQHDWVLDFEAADPDSEDVEHALTQAPQGASLDGNRVSWLVDRNLFRPDTAYTFTIQLTDGNNVTYDTIISVSVNAHSWRMRNNTISAGSIRFAAADNLGQ
ncbi:MAG: hypothetical protein ACLFSB_09435 [Chitinispirillaceae bacterium]